MEYIFKNARFTVITEGVIRMEYAENAHFLDDATLFAIRENTTDAEIAVEKGIITVKTPKLTLTYKGDERFSSQNLSVHVHTAGVDTVWCFGDELKNNLGGTLVTMDGVDGERDLPDGLISRDGFYVIDDSGKPVLCDGWIKNRSDDHLVDLYFFAYGSDYKAALRDLSAACGKMELVRKCVMGSWYSRWWKYSAEEFISLCEEYDKNDFPLDIMVMDMDWHYQDWGHNEGEPYALYGYGHAGENLGWTGYTWNRTLIPNPDELLGELKTRGLKVVLNDHPADGLRDHDEHYPEFIRELEDKGYTEKVPLNEELQSKREKENLDRNIKNFRFDAGDKDYMDAFFRHALHPIEKQGVEFWWLDWQQDRLYPTVNGIKDTPHLSWLNCIYYEHSKREGKRGASFSRWGGIGDHKHPAYFSGDAVSSFETLAFEIKMTVSAANAGCFWWSHDIGGFVDPVPGGQAENYVRWVQFGAISASLRLHMNGVEGFDRRPWTWGEPYCSAMRDMFHLRSRLIPLLYSAAYKSYKESLPFIRPLYYDYPDEEAAYQYPTEFFLGDGMIASPVCTPMGDDKTVKTEVWLPDDIWYDFFTGKRYDGGRVFVENGLETFPLFVREGYPVVTQPYRDRMTSAPYTSIFIDIFAGSDGESFLYEDDGETEAYKSGENRITVVKYSCQNGCHKISLEPEGSYENAPQKRDITVKLKGIERPSNISEGYSFVYNEDERTAEITINSAIADNKLEIVVS